MIKENESPVSPDSTNELSPEAEAVQFNQRSDEADSLPVSDDSLSVKNESTHSHSSEPKKNDSSDKKDSKPVEAPKVIKEGKASKKSGLAFISFLGLGLAGLFVLFILLMVLVIARGGESSPVLMAFGLEPTNIRSFLLSIVNISFGFLSLLFFVIGLIGVFKGLFVKKEDKEGRKKAVWMTIIGIVPLVICLFVWVFLFNLINRIQVGLEQVKAEIVLISPETVEDKIAPLQVTFSSKNVITSLNNKSLPIKGVRWDLDSDGKFETEARDFEITYLYQNRGNYRVGLSVDIEGESSPRLYYYPLNINQASFEATPDIGNPPLMVKFDASQLISSTDRIKSLDWDFDGDGSYEESGKTNLKADYVYNKIGEYRVHLRFVNQSNIVQNFYRTISVKKGGQSPIEAVISITPSAEGVVPYKVRFDAGESTSSKGKITAYEWDFGDGSSLQNGRSVTHEFLKAGDYEVVLVIKDEMGLEARKSQSIKVSEASAAPLAKINLLSSLKKNEEGIYESELPLKLMVDGGLSTDLNGNIVDFEWDFGDKSEVKKGQKSEHLYEEAGLYELKLTVYDSDGQKGEEVIQINILEPELQAVIVAEPQEGTVPLVVRFDGSSSSAFDGKIVTYEWDFGDGSPVSVTGARISHRYDKVGTYTVKLKVTTNLNETNVVTKSIFVREVPLRACFSPSRNKGKLPLSVTFDPSCSTGGIKGYRWNFGDGESVESRKPAHTFSEAGSYNVTLEVFDDKNNVSTFSELIVAESE